MQGQALQKPQPSVPEKQTSGFGTLTLEKSAELAAIAVAAAAKAEVETACIMALQHPRHEDTARTKILAACRLPLFAAKARYRKPVGKKEVAPGRWEQQVIVGPSIRFAEEAIRCWRNVMVQQTTIFDDATRRIVKVTVRDLEANIPYSKEVTLDKTVERRNPADREVIGQRTNTENKIVYIVKATEDELAIKEAAMTSKVIRNNALRLIPQYILDEALTLIEQTARDRAAQDPDAERRELVDGFARRGILPTELERYFGRPAGQYTPAQLVELREMLTSIEEGHASWSDYLDGTTAEKSADIAAKSQPETKGQAILEKIGKAEPPQPATPAASPTPAPPAPPATPPPSVAGTAEETADVTDEDWFRLLEYLDADPTRAQLKKRVREAMKIGNLTLVKNPKRRPFVLSFGDAARRESVSVTDAPRV